MFNKKVMIDGVVYSYHEATEIKHVKDRQTAIRINSYKSNPNYGYSAETNRVIYVDESEGLTFNQAEALVQDLPEFDEYVDSETTVLQALASVMTDEQASTVTYIFEEWDAHSHEYAKDDRVRYSDGFYKCLQGHTSQVDWYPSNAPSLWASIIDATILPIGEYPLWQQPDSTNPYMTGDRVTYSDRVWESIMDYNVWAPGVYGWIVYQEPSEDPDEPPAVPEWVQPDSSNPYMTGDHVMYEGEEYVSLIDNNVWSPADYPQGWEKIVEEVSGEGGGENEPENSPGENSGNGSVEPTEEETQIPDWVQPSAGNPYSVGDRVMYEGSVYESTIDGNVWSPTDYPQGWTLIE